MEENKLNCPYCKHMVDPKDNFCKDCGEPLSTIAQTFETRRLKNAQLKLLIKMTESITDPQALNVVRAFLAKLKY